MHLQIKGESNLTISSLLNFQGALDLCCFGNGRATYKTELTEILSDYIIKKIVPPVCSTLRSYICKVALKIVRRLNMHSTEHRFNLRLIY